MQTKNLYLFFDIFRHMMLGSKGVDLHLLSQKLEVLSTRKTFEPLEPVPEADIQSYLKNEVENVQLSLIEETHKRVSLQTGNPELLTSCPNPMLNFTGFCICR